MKITHVIPYMHPAAGGPPVLFRKSAVCDPPILNRPVADRSAPPEASAVPK